MAKENDQAEFLSVSDMKNALVRETRNVERGAKLRIQELTQIVTAYERGEISPSEVAERYFRFDDKWGHAMAGVEADAGKTDAELMAQINSEYEEERAKETRIARERVEEIRKERLETWTQMQNLAPGKRGR